VLAHQRRARGLSPQGERYPKKRCWSLHDFLPYRAPFRARLFGLESSVVFKWKIELRNRVNTFFWRVLTELTLLSVEMTALPARAAQ
jgi:hypothetical protein